MPRLTKQEMIEIALCLRIGAKQARDDAASPQALTVKELHTRSAEAREALAERFTKAIRKSP